MTQAERVLDNNRPSASVCDRSSRAWPSRPRRSHLTSVPGSCTTFSSGSTPAVCPEAEVQRGPPIQEEQKVTIRIPSIPTTPTLVNFRLGLF